MNNIYAYASQKAKADEKEWSDSLMADFEKLIAIELSQLTIEKENQKIKTVETSTCSDSSETTDTNGSIENLKSNSKSSRRSVSADSESRGDRGNGDAVLISVTPIEEGAQRRGSDSQLPPRRPRRMPSPVQIKEFFRSTSPFNKKGKKEIANCKKADDVRGVYKNTNTEIPPPVPNKRKKNTDRKIPMGLQNFLTKIRPMGTKSKSPSRGESPGELTSGFNSSTGDAEDSLDALLSSVSIATQTSPSISRSSSFTWMSDCSSSIILNTPGSLSDINDEKSSSSGRSSSSPARLQCENGCGSECDCPTSGSRDSSGESRDADSQEETKGNF